MRALLLLVATAFPVQAETPRISLVFGPDTLNAQAEDIQSIRRIDKATGSALVIRLDASFDRQMTALTTTHVGDTGQLLICGEIAVEPYLNEPITVAQFVISDTDTAHIDRLQALISGPTCGNVPNS